MADRAGSVPTLIHEVLGDARQLIHDEIALARAEVREQTSTAKTIGVIFVASAVLALVGLVLLAVAVGSSVADLFNWPPWVGYGGVAVLAAAGAYVLLGQGRARVAQLEVLPKTRTSLRENIAGIQSKSSGK